MTIETDRPAHGVACPPSGPSGKAAGLLALLDVPTSRRWGGRPLWGAWKIGHKRCPEPPEYGRAPARWCRQTSGGLQPLGVEGLTPETETFRPGAGGVDWPHGVQGQPLDTCRGFAAEQQRLRFHIDLRRLPAGGAPRQGLTVAVAGRGLVGPPGPVQAGRGRQRKAEERLNLAEAGSPFLGGQPTEVGIQPLILAPSRYLPVLLLPVPRHVQPPGQCQPPSTVYECS